MNKVLSVSVAAYNVENCIEKCLESLLKTDVAEKIEIIVIDDGSTDSTWNIIEKFKSHYSTSIIAVKKENGGHGSTINVGIQKASGKYFKIVDADDWVDKSGFENLVRFLENTDVDMVLNPFYSIYEGGDNYTKKLQSPFNQIKTEKVYKFEDIYEKIQMPMHGVTFKTGILKKMGPIIDENCFYVDTEYIMYPLLFVNTLICLEDPVYYYLLGNVNQSVSLINMVKRRNQREHVIYSLVKYFNKFDQNISSEKRKYYIKTLQGVIGAHYKYFMYIDDNTVSVAEIKRFDSWLKNNANNEIYYGLKKSLIMKFIRIQRKTVFVFLKPSIFIVQKMLKIFRKVK